MMEQIKKGVIIRKPEERDPRDFVRGISSGITPEINNPLGDWRTYQPTYVHQKYGLWDTNNCTGFSFAHSFETQMNWLKAMGKIAPDDLAWFQTNGYIDANGSFAISERFAAIMAGTTEKGNVTNLLWKAASKYGILPRADLSYSDARSAQFSSQEAMCADYYNKNAVTQAMKTKALQALQRLNIQYEWIGSEFNSATPLQALESALEQAPLQIAVPVCLPGWNNTAVPICSAEETDHAVTLLADENGEWVIFDHYQPNPKTLAKGYLIPQAVLGVITPRPAMPVVSNPSAQPTQTQLTAFQRILNWIQQKIFSLKTTSASAPPGMWEHIIESIDTSMTPSLKATIISHVEMFGVTFVSTFLFAIVTAANTVPVGTVLSKAWLSVATIAALATAVRAAYNKTFIGNSMGVRQG